MSAPTLIYRDDFTGTAPDTAPLALADRPPPWRTFGVKAKPHRNPGDPLPTARPMSPEQETRGRRYLPDAEEAQLVTAALALRRPLLVFGPTGVGKSTLAYSVAWQPGLGNVLHWGVTSRTTLRGGLYQYDALSRLNDAALRKEGVDAGTAAFGDDFTLGPHGIRVLQSLQSDASPTRRPAVGCDPPRHALPECLHGLVRSPDPPDSHFPAGCGSGVRPGRSSSPRRTRCR